MIALRFHIPPCSRPAAPPFGAVAAALGSGVLTAGVRRPSESDLPFVAVDAASRLRDLRMKTALTDLYRDAPVLAPALFWDAVLSSPVGARLTVVEMAEHLPSCLPPPCLAPFLRRVGEETVGNRVLCHLEKTAEIPLEQHRGLDRWSFAVRRSAAAGGEALLDACVRRIRGLGLPDPDILVFGDDDDAAVLDAARWPNLCRLDCRHILPLDFHKRIVEFGDLFPIIALRTLAAPVRPGTVPLRAGVEFGKAALWRLYPDRAAQDAAGVPRRPLPRGFAQMVAPWPAAVTGAEYRRTLHGFIETHVESVYREEVRHAVATTPPAVEGVVGLAILLLARSVIRRRPEKADALVDAWFAAALRLPLPPERRAAILAAVGSGACDGPYGAAAFLEMAAAAVREALSNCRAGGVPLTRRARLFPDRWEDAFAAGPGPVRRLLFAVWASSLGRGLMGYGGSFAQLLHDLRASIPDPALLEERPDGTDGLLS